MAFFFSKNANFLTLGTHSKYLKQKATVYYTLVSSKEQWKVGLAQVLLNKKVTTKTLSSKKSGLTFDPNVDGFLAPKSNFGNLRDMLSKHLGGKKCTTSGSIHCLCDKVSQFPTLELKLTGND
jgi:hypothetical protein